MTVYVPLGRVSPLTRPNSPVNGFFMNKHIWAKEEDEFLKNNYIEKGAKYCSNFLNLTRNVVLYRARILGVSPIEPIPTGCRSCKICKIEKTFDEFTNDKKGRYGKGTICILCKRKRSSEFGKIRREKLKNNEDYIRKKKESGRRSWEKHRESHRSKKRVYYQNNKKYILAKNKENKIKRLKTDIGFKILETLRNRTSMAIKNNGGEKSFKTKDLIGCSVDELKKHLESLFKPGMTWENYGYYGWHMDHIIPCSKFDLTDPQQQKECFNWKNLQPLWWYENMSKGCRYYPDYQI